MDRNYLLLLLTFLIFQLSFTQEYETKRESHQIIENRAIYLNSRLNSAFGGTSRTYLKIDLPPNTVEWYYSFSTSKGESGTKNLSLALQLTGMLADPSGITSSTLSAIKVPEGEAVADIYLCDQANIKGFLEKYDVYGGTYHYVMEGSVNNTKQAVVQIDDVKSNTWYLGLNNPSASNGVNLNIEVVAITETKVAIEKSGKQQKAELYGGLGWKQFENGDYEKCIEYCNKSSSEYELGWVQANKGLALLMLDKESESMEVYVNAITLIKKQPNSKYVFDELIKDLDNALKVRPQLAGANEIKEIIQLQR